jgi:hypothetical protein
MNTSKVQVKFWLTHTLGLRFRRPTHFSFRKDENMMTMTRSREETMTVSSSSVHHHLLHRPMVGDIDSIIDKKNVYSTFSISTEYTLLRSDFEHNKTTKAVVATTTTSRSITDDDYVDIEQQQRKLAKLSFWVRNTKSSAEFNLESDDEDIVSALPSSSSPSPRQQQQTRGSCNWTYVYDEVV